MKTIKYSEKITEFAPSESTPCWSVYVAAGAVGRDGNYAEGHSYGETRHDAIAAARRDLARKLGMVNPQAGWSRA